jgi:CelD/BcsL family acetyltransferase involved in cellulose biosynthesis
MMEAAFGAHGDENRWQRLELDAVQADDAATALICNKLSSMGAELVLGESATCWRIDLTVSKDQWLASLNKSVRRKIRQLETQAIHCQRAVYKIATTHQERLATFGHLVSLHTARRHQRNEVGCFDCQGFQAFLYKLITDANAGDLVRLSKLELDGTVVAASLCLEGNEGLYVYQAGILPPAKSCKDIVESNPGWLINLCHVEYGRQRKLSFIDYLRGDEKYKSNLGAVPWPQKRFIVVPPIASAQIRQKIWTLAQAAKDFGREVKHVLPQF